MTSQTINQPSSTPLKSKVNLLRLRTIFNRARWEKVTISLIVIGIAMLMQPFFMAMFTWSFAVILLGTLGFILASHFPEE